MGYLAIRLQAIWLFGYLAICLKAIFLSGYWSIDLSTKDTGFSTICFLLRIMQGNAGNAFLSYSLLVAPDVEFLTKETILRIPIKNP